MASFTSSLTSTASGLKTRNGTLPAPVPNGVTERHEFYLSSSRRNYTLWRLRRLLLRPLFWVLVILVFLTIWWSNVGSRELQSPDLQNRLRELFPPEVTKDLQFFPASHHKIHYVGRWIAAPNRLRIDGTFPGVYFDLNITNTTTIILSLQNTKDPQEKPIDLPDTELTGAAQIPGTGQYSFSAASRLHMGAPPISLLALVDQEEYVILPNATSLVAIRIKDMDRRLTHSVRVVAPMTDSEGQGVVQVAGLWLDHGGQLLPVEGSLADASREEMDDFDAESSMAGEEHRLGLSRLLRGKHHAQTQNLRKPSGRDQDTDDWGEYRRRKKLVEIVTDNPSHLFGQKNRQRSGGADGLLAGVMGWEYLLGEMFSVDHVCVGVEGMCLLQNCVNGTASPIGLGDVFFRSGPVGSAHFGHPWPFTSYVPDVLILNLGSSDHYSLTNYAASYNKTMIELFRAFEDTYVALVKAVRTMAYPNHPETLEMQRLGVDSFGDSNAPATIPIFIMRPFRGELEHFTQGAVNRLRAEGDKGVFWLDTSGWLDFEGSESKQADFVQAKSGDPPRWHLTERGNQKVAIYLHMHVCRFLAAADENCAFLPPEVYQGSVFDPSVATFERYIENEKERQMKELFWDHSET